jgi:hypothetical protein
MAWYAVALCQHGVSYVGRKMNLPVLYGTVCDQFHWTSTTFNALLTWLLLLVRPVAGFRFRALVHLSTC